MARAPAGACRPGAAESGRPGEITKSFARIHKANLINFGILPLVFENPADDDRLQPGDRLVLPELRRRLLAGDERLPLQVNDRECWVRVELFPRHRQIIAAGGLLNVASGNNEQI